MREKKRKQKQLEDQKKAQGKQEIAPNNEKT